MDWMRRAVWIDKDQGPDYAKLQRASVGTAYVHPDAANAAAVIADLRAHGYLAGIYGEPGGELTDENTVAVTDVT